MMIVVDNLFESVGNGRSVAECVQVLKYRERRQRIHRRC